MPQHTKHVRVIPPITALVLATFLHGCTHWSGVPEPRALPYEHAKVFRVTLTNGATLVVKEPFIVGDSLIWRDPQRAGAPLSQVSFLEAHSVDKVATALLLLAVQIPLYVALFNALPHY